MKYCFERFLWMAGSGFLISQKSHRLSFHFHVCFWKVRDPDVFLFVFVLSVDGWINRIVGK